MFFPKSYPCTISYQHPPALLYQGLLFILLLKKKKQKKNTNTSVFLPYFTNFYANLERIYVPLFEAWILISNLLLQNGAPEALFHLTNNTITPK